VHGARDTAKKNNENDMSHAENAEKSVESVRSEIAWGELAWSMEQSPGERGARLPAEPDSRFENVGWPRDLCLCESEHSKSVLLCCLNEMVIISKSDAALFLFHQ